MKGIKFSKSMLMFAALVLSLVSGIWQALADGQPYWQFSVPVELKELSPQVKMVIIEVNVLAPNNQVVAMGAISENVPSDGNLNKTVSITALSKGGQDPLVGAKYSITLWLSNGDTKMMPDPYASPYAPWARAKPGTVLVKKLEGKLPTKAIEQ